MDNLEKKTFHQETKREQSDIRRNFHVVCMVPNDCCHFCKRFMLQITLGRWSYQSPNGLQFGANGRPNGHLPTFIRDSSPNYFVLCISEAD